jgi:23S rRNA (cytosine1962-C5)-methyltransferase
MTRHLEILERIQQAIEKRSSSCPETTAYRVFNGFYEGLPGLVLDRYGSALLIQDHTKPRALTVDLDQLTTWALTHLAGIESVLHKQRLHPNDDHRRGIMVAGESLPTSIREYGVNYALGLQLHQDASFYLDTRWLRRWLCENMSGKRVLNTFAYTGTLGVAAGAGGASLVVQTDLNQHYLHIAGQSWKLNQLPPDQSHLIPGDFFRVISRFRHQQRLFDCVILDPPFFSTTDAGRVDLLSETTRLINKVRPLVAHKSWLIVINNALFLSGADFMSELDQLCQSPYLSIERIIPIPPDVTGYPDTIVSPPVS